VILEGQDQIRGALSSIDKKMVEILGRVERLSSIGVGQQQISGQPQVSFRLPAELFSQNQFFV